MKITAVISRAPYLTDMGEHNAVYKVKKKKKKYTWNLKK